MGSTARADVIGSLGDAGMMHPPEVELVKLQGNEVAEQIKSTLATLNTKPDVDVIVIARGGGSEAELAAFSDWELAKAIVGSRVPVVTAIGHRQDRTLADLVADVSVPTPSLVGSRLAGVEAEAGAKLAEQEEPQRYVLEISIVAAFILIFLLLVLGRALGWF